MTNNSSNLINDENLLSANEQDRNNYLYNFMPKKDVNKMSDTVEWFI